MICDLVGEEVTPEGFASLREEIADLSARLDESVSTAESLPHRSKYLLLVIGFLRNYLELHRELVDEVERELRAVAPEEQDAGIGSASTCNGGAVPCGVALSRGFEGGTSALPNRA